MSKDSINIPAGRFDDREHPITQSGNEGSQAQEFKNIPTTGKELGRLNIKELGTYVFHLEGDGNKPNGLDLLMTDEDGKTISVVKLIQLEEGGFELNSDVLKKLTDSAMSNYQEDINKIIEQYIQELEGFGVIKR